MLAEVVANYSDADIPLETMWTDIDYMDLRQVFTLDPERFPLARMQDIVNYLHFHGQHYIVMVDPGVAHHNYPPYNRGAADDIFLKRANGSYFKGKRRNPRGDRPHTDCEQALFGLELPCGLIGSIQRAVHIGTMNSGSFSIPNQG